MCKVEVPNRKEICTTFITCKIFVYEFLMVLQTTDVLPQMCYFCSFVNESEWQLILFLKVVDGSLPMDTVEEKLRELATSCIQECQGNPLTNLAW